MSEPSRVEGILQSTIDNTEYTQKPLSRVEELLLELKEAIEEGASSEKIVEIEQELNLLTSRVDEIAQLPEGSTTGDAELIDIRVGADGKTYSSAGNAVRGQVSDLKSAINGLDETLVSEGTIKEVCKTLFVSENTTTSSSGLFSGGSSGTNAYVYEISAGTNIVATGGNVVGYYATLPVKNSSYTIDNSRRVGPLNNTKLTVPTGASYVAISATSEPSVIKDTKTTSEIVNNLENEFDHINGIADVEITFENEGFISANGLFVENANYRATDFIDCVSGGTYVPYKYRLRMFNNTKIAYYDNEKVFISAVSPTSSQTLEYVEGILPYVNGAKYVRFCTYYNAEGIYVKYASVKNIVVNSNSELATPCDYVGDEITVFNKILCIGDSLTSGTFNYREDGSTGHYINDTKYSFPTYLQKLTGCQTTNMGNGGLSSAEWYTAHQNDDLSGYDCVIIQLGVNDCIRYTTWGETSETAFTNIINKLKTENKNIKIFVANIIPATSYSNEQYLAFSADLLAWVTSTYANDASVIPLDMQQYGHTKDSPAYNCGHLSALGYRRLAQDYKGYIGWYINQNKNVFKEVQFIGTDYYYDPIT